MGLLLDEVNKIEAERVARMAILLISKVSGCIVSGYKHKLPSAAQSYVWSTFHHIRRSQEMKQIWVVFVSTHLPESCRQESELALQLLLDRLLKKLLHNKADEKKQSTASSQEVYVAVSLLKEYRKPTKHPQLKVKRALFVHVLTEMKAVDQPGEPESVLDYTKLWSDLIDRGGLYHTNGCSTVHACVSVHVY